VIAHLGVLERAALFFSQSPRVLRALARRVRSVTVPAGELAVVQGETGDCLFVVEDGYCVVRQEHSPEHSVAVALLGPGDLFGEDAFVSGEASRVSVIASVDLRLLAIDRSTLNAVVSSESPLFEDVKRLAVQRAATFVEMSRQARWDRLTDSGAVIAVYSPKGGTGRTTIALNLVAHLAATRPREVVLLDLALPYPHAALMANLVPTMCLARLRDTPSDLFEEAVLSSILYHPSGVMVLPGAVVPEEGDLISADLIGRAIEVLRRTFQYVVVDLPVAMTDVTLAAFDHSQHVTMIITPEISAVKGASDARGILEMLGVAPNSLTLVVNHRAPVDALSRLAIERGVGRRVDHEIPYDGPRPEEAAVRGSILVGANPRSELARGVASLAAMLEARYGSGPAASVGEPEGLGPEASW
jgi:MinD-like ATPase involved in chromosome partitioning or flagellar assembly